MMPADLYTLPGKGQATRKQASLQIFVLALAGFAFLLQLLTQYVAGYFLHHPDLGEPMLALLPAEATWAHWGGLASLGLALLVALSAQQKTQALFFAILGALAILAARAPLYPTWALYAWYRDFGWDPNQAEIWARVMMLFWGSAALAALSFVAGLVWTFRRLSANHATHGSARWGERKDLEKAGLLATAGLILALWKEHGRKTIFIRDDGPSNVFVQGPPGSGKGAGIVIPTLLTWRHSLFIHDAKGELWSLTAGYRTSVGHRCLRIDPTCADGTAAAFNPLLEIRPGIHEVSDAQNLAGILVDPHGTGGSENDANSHWRDSARDLFVCAILHILYAEKDKTLSGLVTFLSAPGLEKEEIVERMLHARHDPSLTAGWTHPLTGQAVATHPEVASLAQSLQSTSERELSGVFKTALAYLSLYRDPIVAENTSRSDFCLADLADHEAPVSLYLSTPASDLERVRPFFRLLLAQAIRHLTSRVDVEEGRATAPHRHPLLFMLDEFPLLGRMQTLRSALGVLRGYGVRMCLIVQDYSQIATIYKGQQEPEAILSMCDTAVTFTTNDVKSAEFFSRQAGVLTVHHTKRDKRAGKIGGGTVREQEHQRPLLYPDEIRRMPLDEVLLIARGINAVRAPWVRYWKDRELDRRSRIPAPAASDVLTVEPSLWEEIEA